VSVCLFKTAYHVKITVLDLKLEPEQ
jgi:hypothetical protein